MVPPSPPSHHPVISGSPHCYDFSQQGLVPRRKIGCKPSNFVCWEPAAPIWEINRFLLKDVFLGKKIVILCWGIWFILISYQHLFWGDGIQTLEDCVNHITCRYGRLYVLDRIVPNARLCNVYTLRICKWCHKKQTLHMFILPYQIPKYSDDFWETKSHGLFNMLPHPTWQSIVWLPRIHQYIHGKGADGISYLRQREKNICIGCSRGRMFPRFWRKYILNK